MGYQKIKAFGCIVFEIIDRLAGSESSWDPNSGVEIYFDIGIFPNKNINC